MKPWIVRYLDDKTNLTNSGQKYFHTRHLGFLIIKYFSIMEMYLPGEQKRYCALFSSFSHQVD